MSEIGKLRQPAEHNGQAIYRQVHMVTRAEGLRAWQRAILGRQAPHTKSNLSSLKINLGLKYMSAPDPEKQQNQMDNNDPALPLTNDPERAPVED